MKHLSIAQGQQRLTLVIPDQTPLRAAAKAVRGYRFEGRNDGHAIFSFPAAPDVATMILESFEPQVSPSSKGAIEALLLKSAALDAAGAAKGCDQDLGFTASLYTEPMGHQTAAMNFAWARFLAGAKGTGYLMEQGTGKSLAAIGVSNGLWLDKQIEWVLVVAPNSLRGTWGGEDGEILTHTESMLPAKPILPDGNRRDRLAQVEKAILHEPYPWVILNYEYFALNVRGNIEHKKLFEKLCELCAERPGMLIIDESTMVKNWRAKRTQVLQQLSERFAHTLILTGTPVTASPLDVFAQFEVMDKGSLGYHSYMAFDRAYALRQRRRLATGGHFEEVIGFQHLDDLEARVAKLSFRARAADCLDLPEVVTKSIPVLLSPPQARAISALRTDMMAELDGGETVDGRNILTRYLRMGQIIGGHVGVLNEEGRAEEKPHAFKPNPKLDALMEYLELLYDDPSQKAVVFAHYRPEIEAIRDAARERGWKPVTFYGGVKEATREEGRKRFRDDPNSRIFVAQYRTGSKGLTLISAATVVFYSFTFSLEDFLQARKRVHRIGQTKTVTEAYLLGQIAGRRGPKQTLDHMILESCRRKQNFADIVTGDARKILEAL